MMQWIILAACLLSARAQENPNFLTLQPQTNRETVLKFTATKSRLYELQVSTNLPEWLPLSTILGVATNQYTDSATPYLPSRIYRVLDVTDAKPLTGDHVASNDGDILIHPMNHATFLLRWNGKTIYNDPVSAAGPYTSLPKADLIFVSHDHSDHFDASTLAALKGPNTQIVATKTVYNSLSATLKAITTVLTNGASTNLMGVSIQAIPAYNLTTSFHTKGVGNGYVLTIGDKRLYICGDTEDVPAMRALENIDVAFLAMNSFTMSVARAVSAARAFKPKIVYPYHYQGSSTADLNSLRNKIGTDLGIEVRLRKWY